MNRGDVGMIESRERQCLLPESLARCGIFAFRARKNFERDVAFQSRVMSLINFPHSANAELFVNSVMPEALADHFGLRGKVILHALHDH